MDIFKIKIKAIDLEYFFKSIMKYFLIFHNFILGLLLSLVIKLFSILYSIQVIIFTYFNSLVLHSPRFLFSNNKFVPGFDIYMSS